MIYHVTIVCMYFCMHMLEARGWVVLSWQSTTVVAVVSRTKPACSRRLGEELHRLGETRSIDLPPRKRSRRRHCRPCWVSGCISRKRPRRMVPWSWRWCLCGNVGAVSCLIQLVCSRCGTNRRAWPVSNSTTIVIKD